MSKVDDAPPNFSWLVPGKLAGMAWPQTRGNIQYLKKVGINHLVTLSPERIPPITEFEDIKWTNIAIEEFEAPSLKQILQFIQTCKMAESNTEVIGVHCRQGRGRTGVMLACYLVHFQHLAPERAVLSLRLQRPGSCETYEQEKAVCLYHDYIRSTLDLS